MKIIDKIFKAITVLGFLAIVITTIASVLFRHVLRAPLIWGEELCRYLFVWCVMIAVGIGTMTNQHISMDLINRKMSPKNKFRLYLLSQICTDAFSIFLLISGMRLMIQNLTVTSSAMKISMAIPYAGIPVGVLAILFYSVCKIREEYLKSKAATTSPEGSGTDTERS